MTASAKDIWARKHKSHQSEKCAARTAFRLKFVHAENDKIIGERHSSPKKNLPPTGKGCREGQKAKKGCQEGIAKYDVLQVWSQPFKPATVAPGEAVLVTEKKYGIRPRRHQTILCTNYLSCA